MGSAFRGAGAEGQRDPALRPALRRHEADDDDGGGAPHRRRRRRLGRWSSTFFFLFVVILFVWFFCLFFFKPMPGGRTGIGSSSCKEMLIESTFMNSTVSSVPR